MLSLEAYTRGSSPLLLCSKYSKDVAGATASEANSETQEAVAAPERFSSSAVRGEPPVVDSDGCSGSGLDSSPAVKGPVVAAQPWETRIGSKASVLHF